MASSGIEVTKAVKLAYEYVKTSHGAQVLVFRLDNDKKPLKFITESIDYDDVKNMTETELEQHLEDLKTAQSNKKKDKCTEQDKERLAKLMERDSKKVVEFLVKKFDEWRTEPRIVVFDLERMKGDRGECSKNYEVHCVLWNPDEGGIKPKMIFASSFETFKKSIGINSNQFTFSCADDFTSEKFVQDLL